MPLPVAVAPFFPAAQVPGRFGRVRSGSLERSPVATGTGSGRPFTLPGSELTFKVTRPLAELRPAGAGAAGPCGAKLQLRWDTELQVEVGILVLGLHCTGDSRWQQAPSQREHTEAVTREPANLKLSSHAKGGSCHWRAFSGRGPGLGVGDALAGTPS